MLHVLGEQTEWDLVASFACSHGSVGTPTIVKRQLATIHTRVSFRYVFLKDLFLNIIINIIICGVDLRAVFISLNIATRGDDLFEGGVYLSKHSIYSMAPNP